MKARTILSGACLTLVSIGAIAQTTPPAPPVPASPPQGPQAAPPAPGSAPQPAAAREVPPDQKAYREALATPDPEKKIAALEKWKKDFSTSAMLQNADRSILSTLVEKFPAQTDRIRKFAAAMYRSAGDKKARGSTANQIADQFLTANLLLKDAESYAEKSMKSMSLAEYLNEQISSYEKRKQKPPASEELQKRFQQSRALRVGTLGRIEVRLGRTARGLKLLEESYAANPGNTPVAAALGELAAKSGDNAKALEYLVPVRLSGSKAANGILEELYRKTHSGSLDGLEAMLDSEYRRLYPNPLHLEAYKPSEKRSDRLALAELFTGSGCPPCVAADLAFDAAMERYSRKELAVVVYHEHIPQPDPMTNPDTQSRLKSHGVTGVPTFVVDGRKTMGGGSRDNAKQVLGRFQKDLEADLETPAEAHLAAQASLAGNSVKVHAAVDSVHSESKDLRVQMALVEKELRYSGENGIRFHPMVVRAMGGEKGAGFALEQAGGQFDQVFDLEEISKAIRQHLDDYEAKGHRGQSFQFTVKKYQIDRADLAVVVFVQDDKTKHVLQAAYVDLAAETGARPITAAGGAR